MTPVTDAIVNDFLLQWAAAHSPGPADYGKLAAYYASRGGDCDPTELREALQKGKQAPAFGWFESGMPESLTENRIVGLIGLIRKDDPHMPEDIAAVWDAAAELLDKTIKDKVPAMLRRAPPPCGL
jgi:hypothetical protein